MTDPDTGAHLRFITTANSSRGEAVGMKLDVREGWSAGPLHVHPAQSERLRIASGVFQFRLGDEERTLRAGDRIEVPRAEAHTIRLVGDAGTLDVEFAPALRTDELFEAMFSPGWPRPPGYVPSPVRAWAESRGFRQEIRYLWPRRAATIVAMLAALALVVRVRGGSCK